MEQQAEAGHHSDLELLKRLPRGLAEEYGRQYPFTSNPPAAAPEEKMILDEVEFKS